MFLEKIILRNFRQFYGEQEIIFSCNPRQNVTLIHAENGVGKTTLLNALLWCFYKDLTTRFENPEKIVSNQAMEEEIFEASVEVFFEHDGQKYVVIRKIDEKYSTESFDAYLINKGNYEKLPNPTAFVESVMPREMSRYFFFDGEYAETFSSKKNKSEVRKAVESMLGCNTAIQAKEDLAGIKRGLDKEIAALTKNNQSEGFQIQIDKLEEQTRADEAEIIVHMQNLELADTARRAIQETLRNAPAAREIQQKRDKLEERKAAAELKKKKVDALRVKWIDQYSVGLLSDQVNNGCLEIIKNANIKGQIPSKIAENFVNDIIEEKVCICHREFEAGSKEESAIKTLLAEAGTAVMNDRLMDIRKRMGMLDKAKETALEEYQSINSQLDALDSEIHDYEAQIRECSTQLQSSQITEIAERELALENRINEINELIQKKTRLEQQCEGRVASIQELKRKRDKLLVHNDRAQGLQKKIRLLDATIVRLDEELNKYREESRQTIIEKVNGILKETARRDYFVNIDESFNLDMYYGRTKTPVAKSSGENQLLSIAFIASLVGFAADRRKEVSHLLKPGTMAPLMLDSPFGQLDPSYRKSTAEFLPSLAGQVVLLVSKTQGDADVISALGEQISSEYVLISEVVDEQGSKPSDVIKLHGQEFTCSLYSCEKNRTHIKKVA